MKKRLILIELNEINFDAVQLYIKEGRCLPGFSKLIKDGVIKTTSEKNYEELEPWIQWPSVHTGKKFNEHNIFRLGDIVNKYTPQIFEKVENQGFVVGAISPMNASNALKKPAYFIPDPWTKTKSDESFFSKSIASALSQAVNDNSQSKLTISTIFKLIISFIFLVNVKKWPYFLFYALGALKKSWRKALFLDKFLFEIHETLYKKHDPNFSVLFLNAGAHIQHHYFHNSLFVSKANKANPPWYINKQEDPFFEMLQTYDHIIDTILRKKDVEIIIATGLTQKPYLKPTFYYRLKNHKEFLKKIGITFGFVSPRMTRDFLISFDSEHDARAASETLKKIKVGNEALFGEIDNRGKDIFVVLTYPKEITTDTNYEIDGKKIPLSKDVTFVAIKNGEHSPDGFAYFSEAVKAYSPISRSHVSNIHNTVLEFFGIKLK